MSEVYKKLDDLSKDKYYALLYDEEEKKAYENKCILEDAIEDRVIVLGMILENLMVYQMKK